MTESDQPDAPQADPADLLHWEDFPVGESLTFGSTTVTRQDIIEFASEFDPQPFHLDEEDAAQSLLGGLAASGWHSCALLMRMIYDGYLHRSTGVGANGVDEINWLKPVRAGDVLTAKRTCIEARPLRSRPEMGLCKMHYEVFNQSGTKVMTWVANQLFTRRDTPPQPLGGTPA